MLGPLDTCSLKGIQNNKIGFDHCRLLDRLTLLTNKRSVKSSSLAQFFNGNLLRNHLFIVCFE